MTHEPQIRPTPHLTADPGALPRDADLPALAITATFTAEPVEPSLNFWLPGIGFGKVRFAPFNQVFQSLLDPAGSLLGNRGGINVALIRFEDWVEGHPADRHRLTPPQWREKLGPAVAEFVTAVKSAAASAIPLLVVICPPSPPLTAHPQTASVFDGIEAAVESELGDVAGVHLVTRPAMAGLYPVADYYDARADDLGSIPYTPLFFAALGTMVARSALTVRRAPFKVIALDCDNTLWRGVCGEGGVSAVRIDEGSAAMQRLAVAQAGAGRLICLASKNIEQDVFDVFDNHPDMLLKRDRLVGWRINWSPKSANLRELASELNLGVDSFIFVDDNPVECAEVRASCPEVLTLQLPPEGAAHFIRHVWAFDQPKTTDQDRRRTDSYLQNARREVVRKESGGLDEFLKKLGLCVTISPVADDQMPRAAQLTGRTNQFNASTIRRSEPELRQLLNDPAVRCDVVEVKDRFGDYGLVGQIITRSGADALVVDTFLLSCRVLGRGVEHQMIAHAGRLAQERRLPRVDLGFARTAKNQPALDFLQSVAAAYRVGDGAANAVYQIPSDVAAATVATGTPPAPADDTAPEPAPSNSDNGCRELFPLYQRIAEELNDPAKILAAVEAGQKRARAAAADQGHPADAARYVAPQTDNERSLADLWAKVLGVDRVGLHDDYFRLGGTSLMAVRLVLEIEKAFGRQLPIATVMSAPTVAKMAQRLGDPVDVDDLAVVTFRAEGEHPPLLLLPGVGGHMMAYRGLVDCLVAGGLNRPVHGLEMRPEIPLNRTPRPLETIAAEIVERIKRLQPQGPYLLAGWSFGGQAGFEVARQLKAESRDVAMMMLLDSFAPGYPRPLPRSEMIRRHATNLWRLPLVAKAAYLRAKAASVANLVVHKVLKLAGKRKTDFHMYESPRVEQMVQVCDDAWRGYVPKHYAGRLSLVRATRRPERVGISYDDPTNGWSAFADGVDVHLVDSDHLGLFEEPALRRTAAVLLEAIRTPLSLR